MPSTAIEPVIKRLFVDSQATLSNALYNKFVRAFAKVVRFADTHI